MDANIRTVFSAIVILVVGFFTATAEAKYIGGVRPVCTPPCPSCGAGVCPAANCPPPECNPASTGSGTRTSLSEGNMTETYAGPSLGGGSGGDLSLNLTFNSNIADGSYARVNTVLGVGWTHDYNQFLFMQRSEMFRFDGGGRVTKYSPTSSTTYRSTEGYFETLTRTATGYTVRFKDGTTEDFALVAGSPILDGQQVYWLRKITDRIGNVITLTYTGGLLRSITNAYGKSITLDYQGGKLWKMTDPRLKVTTLQYDSTYTQLLRIIDPEGKTTRYTYNSLYQISRKVDRDGRIFNFGYSVDKPLSVTDGAGQNLFKQTNTSNWATDSAALATQLMRLYTPSTTSRTDGNGKVWQYGYDQSGYLTRIRAPDGAESRYTYDPATLKVASFVDANGHTTSYAYDSQGNLLTETDPLGHQTQYQYEPVFNNVTRITYPNGSITEYQYDANGNRLKETRDLGGLNLVSEWTYDSHGNVLTEKDPNGHITSHEYDADGNRIKTIDPELHVTGYQYDAAGNRACLIDGNGHRTVYDYDGLNRLIRETAKIGTQDCTAADNDDIITAEYSYDGNGNRVEMRKQTNTSSPRTWETTQYQYDLRNRLVQETRDPGASPHLNLVTSYTYDANDNRVTMTDPVGNSTPAPNDHTTLYAYDVQNRLSQVTDALNNQTEYGYDPVGNRIQETDANGHKSCSQYDALNRLTVQIRKMGATSCALTAASDIVTQNFYDTGATIACDHDPGSPACGGPMPGGGNIAYTIDPEGKYAYFKYDAVDRRWITIRKVTDTADTCDGDDWCQFTKYDSVSNVTARIDANGNRTNTTYFDNNWLHTETVDPGGLNLTTTTTYDGAGNAQTVTSPRGNVVTNTYDERNQLVMVVDSIGKVAEYQYDGIGNRIVERDGNQGDTDPATNDAAPETRYAYDAVNRLTQVTDALGHDTLNGYDKDGNLIKVTDRLSHVTCHTYDAINRRTRTAQLMGGTNCALLSFKDLWTDTEYDAVGNVTRLITAKNNSTPDACKGASPPEDCEITRYQYDPADRLVLETYADQTTRQFAYDKAGNLRQRTDQLGQVTQYAYNDLYYLMLRDYQDPAEPDDSFLYDVGGRMTRAERDGWVVDFDGYDAANRLLQTTQDATGAPMVVRYAYDTAAGTRAVTYPGGRICNEQRDLRERLKDGTCDSFNVVYAYDLGNRVETRAYNNGVTATYGYNANNWITSLTHANGGTVADFGYAYDNEGNKQYEQKNHDPANSEAYGYDDVNRLIDYKVGTLVGSTVPLPITQRQYDLDKVGNWDQFIVDNDGAGPGVPIDYQNTPNQMNEYDDPSTNGAGEIPDDDGIPDDFKDNKATPVADGENWAHDKNGNRREDAKRLYVYDDENRLIRVTRKLDAVQTDYRYDALSRRVVKAVGGGATTRYAYDDARIVEEQDGTAATQATYVYGNYIDEVLNMQRGGADYYYHQNALWSVAAVTNASAVVVESYAYTDYGCPSVTISAIGNPWRFTGRQWDEESGLYFYRARYYDCDSGRFLQRDPMGYVDGMNRYSISISNPINFVDPLGLLTWEDFPEVEKAPEGVTELAQVGFTWQPQRGKAKIDCKKVDTDLCKNAKYREYEKDKTSKGWKLVEKPCFPPNVEKCCWQCTASFPQFTVRCEFVREESWVVKGQKTDALLAHENLHITICEEGAGLAQTALRAISGTGLSCVEASAHNYASADLMTKANQEYANQWRAMNAIQTAYDTQTDHGRNAEQQARWAGGYRGN